MRGMSPPFCSHTPLTLILCFTMSSTSLNLGDAVRSDGTLKEASEIVWTYDADESIPFPSVSGTVSAPSSGGPAPAAMVAGVRRTTHVHRPSRRAREAAEAEVEVAASTSAHSRIKRKAPGDDDGHPIPARKVMRKVVVDLDDDDDNDYDNNGDNAANDAGHTTDHSEDGATTELATELADEDYEILKAMADADHHVSPPLWLSNSNLTSSSQAVTFKCRDDRTADIRLIFRRDKEYIHPDTGKCLDGHWCTICL